MSKIKKSKRLRRPNVPLAVGPGVARGGGLEGSVEPAPGRADTAPVAFDYSHVKRDLTRIGLLAGSFIVVLVVLSFIIR
jgi:hypothetical protein